MEATADGIMLGNCDVLFCNDIRQRRIQRFEDSQLLPNHLILFYFFPAHLSVLLLWVSLMLGGDGHLYAVTGVSEFAKLVKNCDFIST